LAGVFDSRVTGSDATLKPSRSEATADRAQRVDVLNVCYETDPWAFDKSERIIYDWNDVDIAPHLDKMDSLSREFRNRSVTKMNQQVRLCVIVKVARSVAWVP
jgi:hypothetical protein